MSDRDEFTRVMDQVRRAIVATPDGIAFGARIEFYHNGGGWTASARAGDHAICAHMGTDPYDALVGLRKMMLGTYLPEIRHQTQKAVGCCDKAMGILRGDGGE